LRSICGAAVVDAAVALTVAAGIAGIADARIRRAAASATRTYAERRGLAARRASDKERLVEALLRALNVAVTVQRHLDLLRDSWKGVGRGDLREAAGNDVRNDIVWWYGRHGDTEGSFDRSSEMRNLPPLLSPITSGCCCSCALAGGIVKVPDKQRTPCAPKCCRLTRRTR
jgi:hypothetical protein